MPRCAFLGRVPNDDLPPLYGCADVFTMLCRNRWGGLEQEGFGIVFVEAAACGVPQVAGDSGERPRPSPTERPGSWSPTRTTSRRWPTPSTRCSTTTSSAERWGSGRASGSLDEFAYDVLARRLGDALQVDWPTDT